MISTQPPPSNRAQSEFTHTRGPACVRLGGRAATLSVPPNSSKPQGGLKYPLYPYTRTSWSLGATAHQARSSLLSISNLVRSDQPESRAPAPPRDRISVFDFERNGAALTPPCLIQPLCMACYLFDSCCVRCSCFWFVQYKATATLGIVSIRFSSVHGTCRRRSGGRGERCCDGSWPIVIVRSEGHDLARRRLFLAVLT